MKLIKLAGFFFCAVLIGSLLAGCQQTAKSPFVSPDISPSAPASPAVETAAAETGLNIAGADKAFTPETVMLTVNGKDVTWDELFYYINYTIGQIQANGGQITGWSDAYQDETTYQEYVLNSAILMIMQNAAVEYGAEQQKISLTPADQEAIQNDWTQQVQAAGSEEAFIAQLEDEYASKDIYMRLESDSYLVQDCLRVMYGEKGSNLTDQDVADYTAGDGYLMAKHILMLTKNTDESGNQTPMTEAEKAKVKEKMEDILGQLKAYSGSDFNGFFDQLMNQHSEDKGGLASYPKGYLFQSGDMVSQFYDGTMALKIGEYSPQLVETEYGYHIIYRTPVDYDSTPMQAANYGQYSLRYMTAISMFRSNIDSWKSALDVSYTDQYKSLDFNKIFAQG
jgi:parvulin-like peptidyl-prolyl isomerase